MTNPGRNDLCPCGSGKKYKKCCLIASQAPAHTSQEDKTVVPRMLDWLAKHHEKEMAKAVLQGFFDSLDEDQFERLHELHPELQVMLNINMGEWTIADADITVKGKRTPVRSVLLGRGGPLMAAPAKDWLQRLVERPLSLYEARKVKPGEGVEVADLLRPEEPVVWVVERAGSQSLVRFDTFGARIVRKEEGLVFSGAMYPLPRDVAAECREQILQEMDDVTWNSDLGRKIVGSAIIDFWLEELVTERPLPKLVDVSTNEPITLVTDHYRVTDWPALIAALEAQPDVEGDREHGWVRFVDLEDGMRRSRASLNVTGLDSLEMFCRTLKSADEARPWLEQLAGNALKYKTREIVDPRSPKALASASGTRRPDIPPEVESQLVREMLTKHYQSWPDTELPALGGKTPRQAVATPEGRQAVVELLKEFEQLEARKVAEGGEPFDFGFLWDRLGLSREREG